MYLQFGDLTIDLHSDDNAINRSWSYLFKRGVPSFSQSTSAYLKLHLDRVGELGRLPDTPPIFEDSEGILNVYQPAPDHFLLHFLDGALMKVTLPPAPPAISGAVTQGVFSRGRLEDVTYTSLAPLLRRAGYYLVHAFAACREEQALLLVGPSMSGKTTTGLSLLLDGYRLLANDVVLLRLTSEGVFAYPTPGHLNIRPFTLELLPQLTGVLAADHSVPRGIWGEAAPVRAIYFPTITGKVQSSRQPLSPAVVLARLMEESVDRWDKQALSGHLTLLQALCRQAKGFDLSLGQDVAALPRLLAYD